ncbi:TIGR03750 family conjugal transfer protein [Pseudomonas oryzihabitans]|uniref:TIGR03750 family conjugal transfer protein n=1 Tax=Pseudomonas oryzihabitans TaxID=47885 RepID=UPI00285C639E|nr:TIGR03750 family conjugal transfer protein [Pseudomonas psychrotolerans]MDR6680155.1 conjugative transfer region protein (TIGR03750 family) [Pseudomonas psychrotolerans]
MDINQDLLEDGTLRFLPNHLNNQPVVIGGLTTFEMFATMGVCGAFGFIVGIPLAFFINPAMPILCMLGCACLGLSVANRLLRRWKRGRPETWLWRQAEWKLAHWGLGGRRLVIRSGAWTVKRMEGL